MGYMLDFHPPDLGLTPIEGNPLWMTTFNEWRLQEKVKLFLQVFPDISEDDNHFSLYAINFLQQHFQELQVVFLLKRWNNFLRLNMAKHYIFNALSAKISPYSIFFLPQKHTTSKTCFTFLLYNIYERKTNCFHLT